MFIDLDLEKIENVINPSFYPYLINNKRYNIFYGGAGSGKSYFIAQKILLRILVGFDTGVKHKFLCLRKTSGSARESIWPLFRSLISEWGASELVKTNKVEMKFTFENGSEILCGGLDDPEKIKSMFGLTGVWLEEAFEFVQADFDEVDRRLRGETDSYKQIIFSFNPISKLHWIYKLFFEKEDPDASTMHSTWKDNLLMKDEKYKDILKRYKNTKDSNKYRIYYLGEFGILENVIYNNWKSVKFPEESWFKDVAYGLDYGYNEEAALTLCGMKDGEYYIQEKMYKTGLTHTGIIKQLGNIIPLNQRRKRLIYVDSAEPELIKEINRSGFIAKMSDKSVKAGIDFCRDTTLYIDEKSSHLLKEIQSYEYKTDNKGAVLDVPHKIDDHLMDAFRYCLYTNWGKVRPKARLVIYGD